MTRLPRFGLLSVLLLACLSASVVAGVIRTVADALGNTPAVCRKSYVHPRVIEAFAAGELPSAKGNRWLSGAEARVLKLLAS